MLQNLQIFFLSADYLQNADNQHICSADYRYLQIWQKISIGCSLPHSYNGVHGPSRCSHNGVHSPSPCSYNEAWLITECLKPEVVRCHPLSHASESKMKHILSQDELLVQ